MRVARIVGALAALGALLAGAEAGAQSCSTDADCDCLDHCYIGPGVPGGAACVPRAWTSPTHARDTSICTAGVFAGTGVCVQDRCCAADVATACSDGLACTSDLCLGGTTTCDHPLACTAPDECQPGACGGGGACVYPSLANGTSCSLGVCSAGFCEAGCWIGAAFRADGEVDPGNPCQRCDVATDPLAWTPYADGTVCGAEELCASANCLPGCFIDGAFRAPGEAKPDEECRVCSTSNPFAWTTSTGACSGDGKACTEDLCGTDALCHHDPIPGCKEPEDGSLYGCSAGGSGPAGHVGLAAGALAGLWLLHRRRRGGRALLLALLCLPALASAAAPAPRAPPRARLAVLSFKAGPGVEERTAELVTQSFTAAIQARTGAGVLTMEDVKTALGFERQKVMMGCAADEGCLAEIGGALGVEQLVTGTLGRLGTAMAVNVQLIEIRTARALRRFSTSVRAASDEAFLDAIPPALEALFPDVGEPPPRFAVALRGQLELRTPAAGAGLLLFEARLGGALRVGGGLVVAPERVGALARLAWTPWRARAPLHPVLALEVTALAADPLAVGAGLNPGVEWVPRRDLAFLLELPLQLFAGTPDRTRTGYALAAASAAWRF